MKLLLLTIFVAAAVANPIPDVDGNIDVIVNGVPEGESLDISHIIEVHTHEKVNGAVVATSNVLHPYTAQGIAEAAAAAEAEAVVEPEQPIVVPEPIVIPEPVAPETPVIPEPIILPAPVAPETPVIPEPVVLPEPVAPETPIIPEPVVLPAPVAPEVHENTHDSTGPIPAPIVLPEAVSPEVIPAPILLPVAPAPVVVVETPVTPVEVAEVAETVPEPALQTGEIFNNGVVSMTLNAPQPSLLDNIQKWFNMFVQYVTNDNVVQTSQIV